jgi:hypothetical protein
MKPLNLDNRPCSPISSNCVIWQGPDIPCIKLCTGDTVSDVIFKLGTELCTIMDQLKVSNYDLSCLNITACPPEDFQALIQLLINKICELNGIPTDPDKSTGCPDCVVSVAPCFVEGTNPPITAMQLVDYVQMIANRVCSILAEIQVINDSINNLVNITNDLQYQIDNLPVYELPKITLTSCAIGSYPVGSQVSLDALINVFINNVWCPFYTATGTTSELLAAVAQKCVTDATLQLSTGTPFGSNGNWIADANYNTVADAINNIWVVLCDLRAYVEDLNVDITVQDTTTVNLTYTSGTLSAAVQDTGWHCLNGFDHYSTSASMIIPRPQVRRIGNVLHFRGDITVPLDNDGTALEYLYKSGTNTYEGTVGSAGPPAIPACLIKAPYTGPGGVSLLSGGSIVFNNNSNAIPVAVLPSGYAIDGTYTTTWQVSWRPMDTGSCNTVLTSMFRPAVNATGALILALFADTEESFVSGCSAAWSTGHLNYIISHVTQGQKVTDFKQTINVYDSTTAGNQTAQPFFTDLQTYPISINANNQNEIGGFSCRLDGLTAFIGPCVTPVIPTPVLDADACAGTCAAK